MILHITISNNFGLIIKRGPGMKNTNMTEIP